jgi:DNA repair protein RadA/Sms
VAKLKTQYQCSQCHTISPVELGKCPECGSWQSFVQQTLAPKASDAVVIAGPGRGLGLGGLRNPASNQVNAPKLQALGQVTAERCERYSTGFTEVDRVLGGGIVPGAYILIGGDPGIGKSTLMLQLADHVALQDKQVMIVAGEESPYQIRLRADRLAMASLGNGTVGTGERLQVLAETNLINIIEVLQAQRPDLVIIDSIQALYWPDIPSAPGSANQLKACACELMQVAKTLNISIVLIGHVTKEGGVSGPKLLEHTVDAVLYLEGEKFKDLRILRAVKNRFGSTQEIGVFEMTELGLREVANPSELFLSDSSKQSHPGSVIVATVEGTRPLLVEIQALVGYSVYASPRRVANGVEFNRLHQIIAVLERRVGLDLSKQDVYINVVGGLRVDEPAADLGIAMAILTSQRNVAVPSGMVLCGEVGLTGEVRPVGHREPRIKEAERLGFSRLLLPEAQQHRHNHQAKQVTDRIIDLLPVASLLEAVAYCIGDNV